MDLTICLLQVMTSSVCMLTFLITVIYMLALNKCKFNKRTKVVISILFVTMSINISASAVSYLN